MNQANRNIRHEVFPEKKIKTKGLNRTKVDKWAETDIWTNIEPKGTNGSKTAKIEKMVRNGQICQKWTQMIIDF